MSARNRSRSWVTAVALTATALAMPSAAAAADVSFAGSAGIGGGTKHLGAFFADAGGEASVWFGAVGIGARAGAFSAGEPDGGGATGAFAAVVSSARFRLPTSAPR